MYKLVTNHIEVLVDVEYMPSQSIELASYYCWVYYIKIRNLMDKPIQLMNRKWLIIDSYGKEYKVVGVGVIGKQPIIDAGKEFSYTSGANLNSNNGIMIGAYEMIILPERKPFKVIIPSFSLEVPGENYIIN